MMQLGEMLAACVRVRRVRPPARPRARARSRAARRRRPARSRSPWCRARRGLLRDVRDHPGRRQRPFARVGDQLAAQQREQARLAAAVGADDADLVAGMHGQRRVLEQTA